MNNKLQVQTLNLHQTGTLKNGKRNKHWKIRFDRVNYLTDIVDRKAQGSNGNAFTADIGHTVLHKHSFNIDVLFHLGNKVEWREIMAQTTKSYGKNDSHEGNNHPVQNENKSKLKQTSIGNEH